MILSVSGLGLRIFGSLAIVLGQSEKPGNKTWHTRDIDNSLSERLVVGNNLEHAWGNDLKRRNLRVFFSTIPFLTEPDPERFTWTVKKHWPHEISLLGVRWGLFMILDVRLPVFLRQRGRRSGDGNRVCYVLFIFCYIIC
ncbi:MAG: hypothetical protein D6820_10015 [Lentisphaerae bacterium]|nr:MAG: hypothetical protein D6820_10015 [Lentisphaerota bacterium]